MPEVAVTSVGAREFGVRVREGDRETVHRVTVPEGLIREMGLPENDLEGVVRESFGFLLQREPASAIMAEFSLDVIPTYFPDYEQELPRRLRTESGSRE